MSAKLVAYEYVPLGFEMVIENTEGKIWNLWFNVQLSDDPEKWDNEVRSINNLQRKLGDLNVNHRLIRAQMAEFCRVHPLFPESIAILYKEIGEEKLSKPVKVGCEGRDLLDSLGHHDSESLNKQQKEILKSYCESLKKWLDKDDRESSTDSKLFGFLGTFTKLKKEWVENLISLIDKDKLVLSSIQSLAEEAFKKKDKGLLRKARQNYLGRPFNCFKCEECARCGCCSTMFIDSTLLCIGTLDEKGSIFTEFRRFIQENVLAYSLAINSWLEEHAPENIIQSTTPSYITKEQALEIANDVHSSLGDKDEVEIWLTACLLKTIKSNQRWHRPTELIDSFPKATSWLKTLDPSV